MCHFVRGKIWLQDQVLFYPVVQALLVFRTRLKAVSATSLENVSTFLSCTLVTKQLRDSAWPMAY